jgi:hypothetical protein
MRNLYFNHRHFGLPILKKYGFVEYPNHYRWACYVTLPNGEDSYIAQIRFYKNLNHLEISKDYGIEPINLSSALELDSLIKTKINILLKDRILVFGSDKKVDRFISKRWE